MRAPNYKWTCHRCEHVNEPGKSACGICGFPSVASGIDIARATGEAVAESRKTRRTRRHVKGMKTFLVVLPIAIACGVIGVMLYDYVARGPGFLLRGIAVAAFWPALLSMLVVAKTTGTADGVFFFGSVAQYFYVWGIVSLGARILRAHPPRVQSAGMRWFLTVLAYLGLLCLVGVVALIIALLLGESHGGALPDALRPIAFIFAWASVLVLPVLGARTVWRRLGAQ